MTLTDTPGALAVEQGLKYNSSHEWVKVEGDTATIGISDFAQVRRIFRILLNMSLDTMQLRGWHVVCLRFRRPLPKRPMHLRTLDVGTSKTSHVPFTVAALSAPQNVLPACHQSSY